MNPELLTEDEEEISVEDDDERPPPPRYGTHAVGAVWVFFDPDTYYRDQPEYTYFTSEQHALNYAGTRMLSALDDVDDEDDRDHIDSLLRAGDIVGAMSAWTDRHGDVLSVYRQSLLETREI